MCLKQHNIPEEGFIINEFILKTLELKPQKVYRCPSYESFDSLLNELQSNINEIVDKLNRPEVKIRDYCDKLRNKIDIATETLIDNINKFRTKMLTDINTYESNCIKSLKQIDKRDLYVKIVKENVDKLDRMQNYLNNCKIEENSVKKMTQDAKMSEYKLKNLLKILNGYLFGSNLLHFDESIRTIDSSLIGKLDYENLIIMDDLLDIDKIVNPKQQLKIDFKSDQALPLFSNKYLIMSDQILKIIDDTPQTVMELKFDYSPEYISHNSSDSIFVQHHRGLWKSNGKREKSYNHTIGIYDYNLNLKHELTPEYQILKCFTNTNNLFIQLDRIYSINVYNWSLEKITTFGQINFIDRPYFFKDYELKFVKNDKIYLRKINQDFVGNNYNNMDVVIRVVSLNSGEFQNEFILNSLSTNAAIDNELFFVDALNRILIIDDIYSSIKIYDLPVLTNRLKALINHANLLIESKNLDLANASSFRMTCDGKLIFIRNKKTIELYSFS